VTDRLAAQLAAVHGGGDDVSAQAGTPFFCADRAVSHDPAVYYRDIEAPTDVHNGLLVLMVAAKGDPVTPYPGAVDETC
jgi:hypothetical protein